MNASQAPSIDGSAECPSFDPPKNYSTKPFHINMPADTLGERTDVRP
jgi:hypothetical protein